MAHRPLISSNTITSLQYSLILVMLVCSVGFVIWSKCHDPIPIKSRQDVERKHSLCPVKGQVRRICAPHPSCMSTCSQNISSCTKSCIIDGCGCPLSKVLNNYRNECVDLSECVAPVCQFPSCNDSTRPSCEMFSSIFTHYAEYHHQVVTHQREGKFLKFVCNNHCGGYGNRISGITMALMFAILSNRTLLIEMKYPFDINRILHPNTILWNYTMITANNSKHISMIDWGRLKHNWKTFAKSVYDFNIDMIELNTNLGLSDYFTMFDDKWNNQFHDVFGVTKDDNIFTYGCVSRYLFTYDKRITDAIDKEMRDLQLTPGKFISAHYRTLAISGDKQRAPLNPLPFFKCGTMIANILENIPNTFQVYFISDSVKADKMASGTYTDKIITSNVRKVHVDRSEKLHLSLDGVIDGFVGALVNIEVAAKGAAFIRSTSTFSNLIESIGLFSKCSVVKEFM